MGHRILKETICTSETIDELDWIEEVAFYRLLVNCDDYGVMDARPKMLKSRLFPLKEDMKSEDVDRLIKHLAQAGLIRLYRVSGKPYLQVTKWAEHQRIRDSKHKYPTPEEADADCGETQQEEEESEDPQQPAATCGDSRRDAARARAESESESESISESVNARTRARETDAAFDRFWAEYPNKVKKPNAKKAWDKLHPEAELAAKIMQGLAKWKNSDQWTRDDGRYIPHPATWLNARQWEDQVHAATGDRPRPALAAQQYTQRDYSEPGETLEELMRRVNGQEAMTG